MAILKASLIRLNLSRKIIVPSSGGSGFLPPYRYRSAIDRRNGVEGSMIYAHIPIPHQAAARLCTTQDRFLSRMRTEGASRFGVSCQRPPHILLGLCPWGLHHDALWHKSPGHSAVPLGLPGMIHIARPPLWGTSHPPRHAGYQCRSKARECSYYYSGSSLMLGRFYGTRSCTGAAWGNPRTTSVTGLALMYTALSFAPAGGLPLSPLDYLR